MSRVLLLTLAVGALAAPVGTASADESPFLEQARLLKSTDGVRLVTMARAILEGVVLEGELDPAIPVPESKQKAAPFGLFVTLVKGKQTRGCYGSMVPTGRTLEDLLVEATVGAARLDPRSKPIHQRELDHIQIIVSIVGPTIPVLEISEVDSKREGLLVRSGDKRAVLLPGEAKTGRWQLKRSLRQARIRRGEPREMFRFRTVTVYERGR